MNAEEVYALLNKKIKKGGITDDKIKQIVEQHFEENPVQVITDNTLSVAGTPADALAAGAAIDSLKEDLGDFELGYIADTSKGNDVFPHNYIQWHFGSLDSGKIIQTKTRMYSDFVDVQNLVELQITFENSDYSLFIEGCDEGFRYLYNVNMPVDWFTENKKFFINTSTSKETRYIRFCIKSSTVNSHVFDSSEIKNVKITAIPEIYTPKQSLFHNEIINFERGGFDRGVENNSTIRARSGFLDVNHIKYAISPNSLFIFSYEFYDSEKKYRRLIDFADTVDFTPKSDEKYVRILIKKKYNSNYYFTDFEISLIGIEIKQYIGVMNIFPNNINEWVQGSISAGKEIDTAKRIRTGFIEIEHCNYKIVFNGDKTYKITAEAYDINKGYMRVATYFPKKSSDWITQDCVFDITFNNKSTDYTAIPRYIRFILAKIDGTDITNSDIEKCKITVTKVANNEKMNGTFSVCSFNFGKYGYGTQSGSSNADTDKYLWRKLLGNIKSAILLGQEYNYYFDKNGELMSNDEVFSALYPYRIEIPFRNSIMAVCNIINTEVIDLGNNRFVLKGYVRVDSEIVCIMCVHLSPDRQDEELRKTEREKILSMMQKEKYCIVGGDFNSYNASDFDIFTDAGYIICNNGYFGYFDTYTDSVTDQSMKLDNIIMSNNILLRDFYVSSDKATSDHYPIIATLQLIN